MLELDRGGNDHLRRHIYLMVAFEIKLIGYCLPWIYQ